MLTIAERMIAVQTLHSTRCGLESDIAKLRKEADKLTSKITEHEWSLHNALDTYSTDTVLQVQDAMYVIKKRGFYKSLERLTILDIGAISCP